MMSVSVGMRKTPFKEKMGKTKYFYLVGSNAFVPLPAQFLDKNQLSFPEAAKK